MTVRGPIPAKELGPTLPHEHVFLDFVGADQVSKERYDPDVIHCFVELVEEEIRTGQSSREARFALFSV